jgi:DNA-binding NarL/FixJ family response regulator
VNLVRQACRGLEATHAREAERWSTGRGWFQTTGRICWDARNRSAAVRILAIEDHQLFLDGLRHLLRALAPQVDLFEAMSRHAALGLLEEHGDTLDLVVLDLGLQEVRPFEVLLASRRLAPQAPVAVLSATEDRFEVQRALELGAQAYLFKSTPNAEIVAALRRVMLGEVVSPLDAEERRPAPGTERLTERQLTVIRLLSRGASNKEIAARLGLTENTVKVHLANCYRVLGVTTRTAAVRKAIRAGLIEDE